MPTPSALKGSPVNGLAKINHAIWLQCDKYYADHRKDRDDQAVEYLWGNQGIRSTAREMDNDFVHNFVYKDHSLAVSMLARDVPSIKLVPLTESVYPYAEPLTAIVNHALISNEFAIRMVEMLSYGLPLGRGFFKIGWDGTMRMGLGDTRIDALDPRNIRFIPGVANVARSLVLSEKQQVTKLTALHMYPKHRRAIEALFQKHRDPERAAFSAGESDEYVNVEGTTSMLAGGIRNYTDEKPFINIIQQWVIDPTTLKELPNAFDKLKDNAAYKALRTDQQDEIMSRPIYPRGKVCIFCEDHLFEQRPNPFPSFPYVQYMNQYIPAAKPGDELGMGEYDQIFEGQDAFNARYNQAHGMIDAQGTRTLPDGEVERDEWAENPNGIFVIPRGTNVHQVTVPGPGPEVFRSLNDEYVLMREIQNRSDISQGQNPSGARSGEQVVELSELANRVMVTRTHSLEACVRALTRYVIHMVGAEFYQPGYHYADTLNLKGVSPDAFEIVVKAGLNLPASQSQVLLWLRTLAEMKAIDREVLLEATPDSILPNKQVVIERMRQQWQAEAQAMRDQQEAEVAARNAEARERTARSNVIPMNQGVA